MNECIIQVEQLCKRYRIGRREDRYPTFREALARTLAMPVYQLKRLSGRIPDRETFWALRDVSFEVRAGEVIGIIGRNGAGKSTLLKILSRITEPTAGRAVLRGRVASLLEVGTGFHPELTGRENIFVNGAILGMQRNEIRRKFDEIVAFAEIGPFLDTPVKRYSSGMYVRLAFAVAAHLDPEILIVDEVLAVGDAEFQKKCLGKMQQVSRGGGRTVLFVSHNMAAVTHLCDKAMLLQQGRCLALGPTRQIVDRYLDMGAAAAKVVLSDRADREGTGELKFTALKVLCNGGLDTDLVQSGSTVRFELDFLAQCRIVRPRFFLAIYDGLGTQLLHMNTDVAGFQIGEVLGPGRVTCTIQNLPLTPGQYRVNVAAISNMGTMLDRVESARVVTVEAGDFYGTGNMSSATWGRFLVGHSWTQEPVESPVDVSSGS